MAAVAEGGQTKRGPPSPAKPQLSSVLMRSPPSRPSPSSPVYWFWGDATLKPSAGGRWERSI